MKLELQEKNYRISPSLHEILEQKVDKLNRYFDNNAQIKILCKKERELYIMELNITAKGMYYRVEVSNTENMYSNIDLALPKLERQIIRHKEKLQGKVKSTAFDAPELEFIEELVPIKRSSVVKQKYFDLVPLTTDDAQMMLEATDHTFYIYLNAVTGRVNVIYKRNDGNYGNIEVNY